MDKFLHQAGILLLLCSLITDLSAEFTLAQPPIATSSEESTDSAKTDSGKPETTSAKQYSTREFHDPNGIGKFYMGREIAHVMGYSGAAWLERDSREKEERLTLLVKSLKIKPNMTIADIGAGSGVITFLIAEQLGDKGRVLGVDVQDEMLNRLKERAQEKGITNVVPVKGTQTSPNLKPGTVDVAIMVDVYHEFEFPYEMLNEIARALKPGGRVAFVEYRKEDPTVPIKLVHKMTEAQVRKEAGQLEFGLRFKETIGVLPRQHIVVFERIRPKKSGVEK
jgi:SAM-dependent methyltransferase